MISCTFDEKIKIWDTKTFTQIKKLEEKEIELS